MAKLSTLKQPAAPPTPASLEQQGQVRVIIEGISPQVDAGRFAVKRVVGDAVQVSADVFTDGHDAVLSRLLYRREGDEHTGTAPMEPLGNDRFSASFVPDALEYQLTLSGVWLDR